MATPPLLGLNSDVCEIGQWPEGVAVPTPYVEAVIRAGGAPLILPPNPDRPALEAILNRLDGLILTGGWDLQPEWYGQPLHPATRLSDPRRLAGDRMLVELILARELPVLGICLGCQLLNVALGGTLIQDIPSQVSGALAHSPRESFHAVRVDPHSRLRGIVGCEDPEVNSSHHQALGQLAQGLRAVAWAPDGIVEAVEGEDGRFLLGVQWHPERLIDRPEHLAIFRALVEAAAPPG